MVKSKSTKEGDQSKSESGEKRVFTYPDVSSAELKTSGIIEKMLCTERATELPAPNWEPLPHDKVFDEKGLPIMNNLRAHFSREGLLSEADSLEIITRATAIFRKEPNVLAVQDPIIIVGDLHGQYFDVVRMFEIGGDPSSSQYLFFGDYVDRGCFGCEVVLFLFAYKIRYPKTFWMLRGNHECRQMTAYFNTKREIKYKYTFKMYEALMIAFDCLPLAAILNGRFLCVHAGIGPEIKKIQDIEEINRFREPLSSGPMCDILWSDPAEDSATNDSPFTFNELRGCSWVFNYTAACRFLSANKLLSIIRGHEAQDQGYKLYKKSSAGFPSVICVFSAPNYCDKYNNKAALIRLTNNLMHIKQFNSVAHPYYLPNFMNAFTWSFPFVAEKLTDMLKHMWELCEETVEEGASSNTPESDERHTAIRNKILAMGKMSRMFRTLREENESIVELKGLAGGHLPLGILQQGPQAIKSAIKGFEEAKALDKTNEKRPPYADDE